MPASGSHSGGTARRLPPVLARGFALDGPLPARSLGPHAPRVAVRAEWPHRQGQRNNAIIVLATRCTCAHVAEVGDAVFEPLEFVDAFGPHLGLGQHDLLLLEHD